MPAYWLDLRGYDPPESAKAVKASPCCSCRVSRDYQVQTVDLENWKKALGSRHDVEFHLYPKLNHLFYEGEGSSSRSNTCRSTAASRRTSSTTSPDPGSGSD